MLVGHETTHVWQQKTIGVNQLGYINRTYDYTLEEGKSFRSYTLEQQASIVGDLIRAENGYKTRRALNDVSAADLKKVVEKCMEKK